ncbi:MAG: hypothetical protein Q7S33_01840 [Nanoarchaeota archaeon]|nr:hypothetical protein [Nanoarchaeota archaeon]
MDISRISRIIRVQNALEALRYGFPGATNPIYSNLELRRTCNNIYAVKPIEPIAGVGYTKDATKEKDKGGLIDLIA